MNAEPQKPPPPVDRTKKSALTIALEKTIGAGKSINQNPFNDYAIFDGRTADGKTTGGRFNRSSARLRPFTIWFMRIPGVPKISVCVQPSINCTVRDLVGLSLWQYFNENPTSIIPFNGESCHFETDARCVSIK